MNSEQYFHALDLERAGNTQEGIALLLKLANEGDPLALLDMSNRYFSTEGYTYQVADIKPDEKKSENCAILAKERLIALAEVGDGEAMRMLALTYLGHWHPILEKSIDKAEKLLLKAFDTKCYFAANDLALFYIGSDIKKAKFYYQEAERNNCRVIHDDRLET